MLINLYVGTFKERHFITENLKKYREAQGGKCKLSINSTQRVTSTFYEDIKRIRLRIPEGSISLVEVSEFQVIPLLGERKRGAPFYIEK